MPVDQHMSTIPLSGALRRNWLLAASIHLGGYDYAILISFALHVQRGTTHHLSGIAGLLGFLTTPAPRSMRFRESAPRTRPTRGRRKLRQLESVRKQGTRARRLYLERGCELHCVISSAPPAGVRGRPLHKLRLRVQDGKERARVY